MRLFLDANVLFSAAKSDGAVRRPVEALVVAGLRTVHWAGGHPFAGIDSRTPVAVVIRRIGQVSG
jgi:hypothetical protein